MRGDNKSKCRMKKSPHNKKNTLEAGFTLLELLVVLVILVLIAGLVAPRVIGYLGSSKTKTAKVQISALQSAIELYKLDTDQYPSTEQGLSALIKKPDNAENWNGPYLKRSAIPKDPWGNGYHYKHPGTHGDFDIYSLGSDNKEGGDGDKQDIVSW